MTDIRRPTAVTPASDEVQEQIHFDNLWSTAQDALDVYSGQRWSARGDDDPGVTLMQAFAYGVSDVSYRHTLPLKDLLTEPPGTSTDESLSLNHDGGIFAREFGPEWALTSSPVTIADYRRAILDLTIPLTAGGVVFCFRDAQIVLQPVGDSYGYTYDQTHYAFQFVSEKTPEASRYRVAGRYRLWVTFYPEVDQEKDQKEAMDVLVAYLNEHRNLCEWEIVPEDPPVQVAAQQPQVQLILEDDLPAGKEMNQAVAQAIWAINQALLPLPVRQPAQNRLARGEPAEQVYNGPRLEHGWISHLPPARDVDGDKLSAYSVPVQVLSAAVVGVVPGIKAIEWADPSAIVVKKNQHAQLWVDVKKQESLDNSKESLQVYKRGQQITTTTLNWNDVKDAYQALKHAASQATPENPRQVSYGRYRNPGFYRSVGASLPPVYGLQQSADVFGEGGDKNARQLLMFLRPFEQVLANSADQLKKLPRLLAFDGRDPSSAVWGESSWPRPSEDPLTAEQTQSMMNAMKEKMVLARLQGVSQSISQDPEKELAILNYLLGYFGEQRAVRALVGLSGDHETFLHVQQGFLRQVTRLAYERAAISISKISALQRKIAARLGVGEALFKEGIQKKGSAFPDDPLPFYLIEHQELLPHAPAPEQVQTDPADWPGEQVAKDMKVSEDGESLTLTLVKGEALKVGQLIELQGTPKNPQGHDVVMEPMTAIVLHQVDKGLATIELKEHARLQRSVPQLLGTNYSWKWRLGQTWLKRVAYDLAYTPKFDPKKTATAETVTLDVTQSFPVGLKKGQRFALRPKDRWQYWPTKADLVTSKDLPDIVAEVVDFDPVKGTVTAKWIGQKVPNINEAVPSVDAVNLDMEPDKTPHWPDPVSSKFPYAWSAPYAIESFSFTLSIVLNRDWLTGNAAEMSQWIEQIVREEMPSHLNLQLHWLSDFDSFASRYLSWQKSNRPVGDQSYELLRLLGIGERPVDQRMGIGFVRVATAAESKTAEATAQAIADPVASDKALQKYSVVYVRKTGSLPKGTP